MCIFHHTDWLHIHAHKRCTTAQRHIFHTNCKYILDNRFNTTCPTLLHHHNQKHIKCGQHIQPTSQHVLLHHHCLLQHYSYNQKGWTTLGMLHLDSHTQDKCSFTCIPYSCQPFPSPCSDSALSYQFFFTSSGTSIVEAAAMVEEAGSR